MFKFDFKLEDEDASYASEDTSGGNSCQNLETLDCYDAKELFPSEETWENVNVYRLWTDHMNLGDVSLNFLVPRFLIANMKGQHRENISETDMIKAENRQTDLIKGVYEGGAKIWECTDDLLKYINENIDMDWWRGKRVLDLGCGAGLLGIYAHKCGAEVHFQDYNEEVIEKITIPNLLLNLSDPSDEIDNASFFSGDWSKYTELTKNKNKFDLILTSETIYNSQNYRKILDVFRARLEKNGIVLVAAKTYYFGVGGGLREFEKLVNDEGHFCHKVVWATRDGIGREILRLNFSNM